MAIYAKRVESKGKACEVSDEELIKSLSLEKGEHELHALKFKLMRKGLLHFSTLERPRRTKHVNGKPAGTEEYGEPQIFLSEQGLNLARKYASLCGTFELWCRENIWFWVVLSAILSALGIFITILLALLKD